MAVKKILVNENKKLRKSSKKVLKVDNEIFQLIQDLKDTLKATGNGVGLAAPQIGVLKRVIYIDLRRGQEPIVLINPKITFKTGRQECIEGCLSCPGYEGKVIRPKKITVTSLNLKGEEVEYKVSGFLANVFCHEIDHLDGILYIDRAKKVYKLK